MKTILVKLSGLIFFFIGLGLILGGSFLGLVGPIIIAMVYNNWLLLFLYLIIEVPAGGIILLGYFPFVGGLSLMQYDDNTIF